MKKYSLLAILIFTALYTFGQQDSSKTEIKQWNKFKNEVGLDFQFLNRNSSFNNIGGNLIFKRHIGEKKFISRNEKKALRIQLGGAIDYPVGSVDSLEAFTSFQTIQAYENKLININLLVGIEWQKQYNRLQIFYGFDTGIRYNENVNPYSITYISVPNNQVVGYSTNENKSLSIPLIGFFGIKYFLHPRVSLSIESAILTSFAWNQYKRTNYDANLNETSVSATAKRKEINFNMDYIRYLNVSYYF